MNSKYRLFAYSIPWNIFLLTVGSFLVAMSIKSVAVPQGFVTGGVSGIALLIYYFSEMLTPGLWLFILNIPIALIGWIMISRRFVLYTAYGMCAITGWMETISFTLPVHDPCSRPLPEVPYSARERASACAPSDPPVASTFSASSCTSASGSASDRSASYSTQPCSQSASRYWRRI